MHVLPTSNIKFSESQVNHAFLGTFCLLFRKFALKQGQNFGAHAPYRRVGFAIPKWHTRVQNSGKNPPPPGVLPSSFYHFTPFSLLPSIIFLAIFIACVSETYSYCGMLTDHIKVFVLWFFVTGYLLPLCVICLLYCLIVMYLYLHRMPAPHSQNNAKTQAKDKTAHVLKVKKKQKLLWNTGQISDPHTPGQRQSYSNKKYSLCIKLALLISAGVGHFRKSWIICLTEVNFPEYKCYYGCRWSFYLRYMSGR